MSDKSRVEGEAAPAPQAATQDNKWHTKKYPCGCSTSGPNFLPDCCPTHDSKVSQAEAPRPSAPNDKLLALVKASVHLAILRHDLGDDDMDIDAILEDTANAVRGIDTCAEEPIQEWTAVAESRPSAEHVLNQLLDVIREDGWQLTESAKVGIVQILRLYDMPAKFEVGKTYPANVNGEPGTVMFFSEDAAKAYSKQLESRPSAEEVLAGFRADGWMVAVHNDYRVNDEAFTFWLLTKGDRCAKGEGRTDLEALNAIRIQERITRP
jgi:hypothetical protein